MALDLSLIERVVMAYLDKHPEILEKLIERLLDQMALRLSK